MDIVLLLVHTHSTLHECHIIKLSVRNIHVVLNIVSGVLISKTTVWHDQGHLRPPRSHWSGDQVGPS